MTDNPFHIDVSGVKLPNRLIKPILFNARTVKSGHHFSRHLAKFKKLEGLTYSASYDGPPFHRLIYTVGKPSRLRGEARRVEANHAKIVFAFSSLDSRKPAECWIGSLNWVSPTLNEIMYLVRPTDIKPLYRYFNTLWNSLRP